MGTRTRTPEWLRTRKQRPRLLLAELTRRQKARARLIRAKALPHWLRAALVAEFGSVNAARKRAGLDTILDDAIDPARVIPQIKKLHVGGQSLAYSHVPMNLVSAAVAKFGSWQAAIEAAGLDYAKLGLKVKRYSDDELLDWLRALAKARPSMTLVELHEERRFAATVTRFGTWQGAVKRAGLADWPVRQKKKWTKRAVVDAMRALARDGKSISTDPNVCQAAKRHFGSLQAAAAVAGVQTRAPRSRSRKEVIAALRKIARTYGTVTNALAEEAGIRSAAAASFGTLTAACEAAGVVGFERLLAERHATQDDPAALLGELRAAARRVKRPVMRRDLSWTLYQALLRHFESLDDAREHAGLSQPTPERWWSRARVLEELRREHRRGTRITRNGLVAGGRRDLLSAIPVYVGTLEQARRVEGIPTPERLPASHVPFLKIWDEDRVIDEINERAAAGHGLAPSLISRPLMSAACRYWKSWRNACEVAGHDYAKLVLRRDWTDQELLALIRTIAATHPAMTLDRLRSLPVTATLYRRFGTPEAAAKRAGLADWPIRETFPVLSKQQLRDLLRARIRAGEPIGTPIPDRHVRFSMSRIHPVWSVALARLRIGASRMPDG